MASACADYAANRDSVTFAAGDAVETNKAIQTIFAFPPAGPYKVIYVDGRRVYVAMKKYQQQGSAGATTSASTTTGTTGVGMAGQ